MEFILGFVLGAALGATVALAAALASARKGQQQMREAFSALAGEALDANTRRLNEILEGSGKRLGEQAAAQLESKKALIDQSLSAVGERLELVRQFVQRIETERKQDLGQLAGTLGQLSATTGELHKMLASTQRRGAWGERMAEDVLRLAGLQEGVNYLKQSSADAENGRADFTFLLPNNLKANMDVKFPLEKYKAYVDSPDDDARRRAARELCLAVKGHVRDVSRRGYIDPQVPTVPYVIVFIPSEQIFSLVLETAPDLIDEALSVKVVLASPLTLYAKLAIMRQAAESFNLMQTANEVITLLGQFSKQWKSYNEELDKLGQRIELLSKQYEVVRTTRTHMLQRPLDKIEDLRAARNLSRD